MRCQRRRAAPHDRARPASERRRRMADDQLEARVYGDGPRVAIDRPRRRHRRRRAEAACDAAYERGDAGEPGVVLLNFGDVDYINSTGIALIVGPAGPGPRATASTVAACGLSDHYREIFEITRLSDFMQIYRGRGKRRRRTATEGSSHDRGNRDHGRPSAGRRVASIDIAGEITAACEDVLMDAYATGQRRPNARRSILNFTGLEYMNSERHRPARHPARAGEPPAAAAARVRAERPLPPDLRAHPARRGDRHPRDEADALAAAA